jgi:hypothetical protein
LFTVLAPCRAVPPERPGTAATRTRHEKAVDQASHQPVYAVTSLTSADPTAQDLLAWSGEPVHRATPSRDVTFGEDAATSRTGSGPANLAAIRTAITAALKDADYLRIPEGGRDHTTPAEPSSTASIKDK